jgi:hypothetical protein
MGTKNSSSTVKYKNRIFLTPLSIEVFSSKFSFSHLLLDNLLYLLCLELLHYARINIFLYFHPLVTELSGTAAVPCSSLQPFPFFLILFFRLQITALFSLGIEYKRSFLCFLVTQTNFFL